MPFLAGCNEMVNQPKLQPFQESDFFADGRASRPRVPGTVARGQIINDELRLTGTVNGQPADLFPAPVTPAILARGRERFNIYCAPCHDRVGSGNGMVVRRGMPRPPSFHDPRLVKSPAGYFVQVMTQGFGRMDSYADRLAPDDRWAVAAYIRALQESQNAPLAALTAEERARLESEPVATSTRTALGDLATW